MTCPADVCPDQQAARPRTGAPHPVSAQNLTRSVCGAQSQRAHRAAAAAVGDWSDPGRHSLHTYLLYQLCQQARGTTLGKN